MLCTECHMEVSEEKCVYDKAGNPYHPECFVRIMSVKPPHWVIRKGGRVADPSFRASALMLWGSTSRKM